MNESFVVRAVDVGVVTSLLPFAVVCTDIQRRETVVLKKQRDSVLDYSAN